jgi:hypothetical protein
MKRLVIIPLALFQRGNSIHNNQLVKKIEKLAGILAEEFKDCLPHEKKELGTFKEIYVLCSESPAAQKTAEIFTKVLGVRIINTYQELCSTDGHRMNLPALHSLVLMQRSEVVILITDQGYATHYPKYFSIRSKHLIAIPEQELKTGEALIIKNEIMPPGTGMTEKIIALVEEPASVIA